MTVTADGDSDPMRAIRPVTPTPQPVPPLQSCRVCGYTLAPPLLERGEDTHPNCKDAGLKFAKLDTVPGSDDPMRTVLIDLIRAHDRGSVRSRQVAVGPSEIGGSCDRRLGMRIAGVKMVNRSSDPWPAIVGTSIHEWLRAALQRDNDALIAAGRSPRWILEEHITADRLIHGTSDAYDTWTGTVIDWKTMGDTARRKLAEDGPSDGYVVQINTYGLGFVRAGYPVKKVALMFLPRSGNLKDARYFEWDFDPEIAHRAIERVYAIGRAVLATRQQQGTDEIWHLVPSDVTALCGWCPYFRRGLDVASSRGCPGK